MRLYTTLHLSVAVFILAIFLIGCDSDTSKEQSKNEELEILDEEQQKFQDNVKKAKSVLYSLPSPLETAILFRHAGATFDESILNPLDNMSKYTTNTQKALNLGIYSADLSYASLFEQTQISIKYMAASKRMAEGLGVMDAIDREMISKLEDNVNNKAIVMDMISKAFINSNVSLKQNDRASIATIMLVGGWVEGLYIATKLTTNADSNNELVDRVVDQRLPLKSIIELLKAYQENSEVAEILVDINELKEIFDKIKVTTSRIVPVTDTVSNVTTLKSTSETVMSEEVFRNLCIKVEDLRNSYIN
jgi:hypothetical protein